MSLDPISAALNIGTQIIDRLWPNPTERDAAKLELLKLQQNGDLAVVVGQMEINKVEAANSSLFVAGWRPAVGWVCVAGLSYTFVAQPLLAWASSIWFMQVPPVLDMGTLITLLGGMLGLGGLRTYEKTQGVAR